jgi:hypothetical protein
VRPDGYQPAPQLDRPPRDYERPHSCTFQMQVVRDGVVIYAIERRGVQPNDVKEMTEELWRWGAELEELRLVSSDAPLYNSAFRSPLLAGWDIN